MNKDLTEYEKDLNEIKEQILKEGNTLLTKRDLLERFCVIDKEYNGRPWNLLQILANINILIGEEKSQPNIGHWIYEKRKRLINETDEGAEYITDYWCKCSKCGGDFGFRKMKDAFCKYCGTKMIEPQESEES